MRAWLVTVGEPLPSDGGRPRLWRAGILANMMALKGHEVLWWTSTFDHFHKRHRFEKDTALRLDNGVEIRLLKGCGYRRNVSLRRVAEHVLVARRFSQLASLERRPDVVLCSLPTLELSVAAVRYGRRHSVPVVIDIRDLWPDIFTELVPPWARPAMSLTLAPMLAQARTACRQAFALTGNSPQFVEWGLKLAGRAATRLDRHFPFAYASQPPAPAELTQAAAFWRKLGLEGGSGFILCFFGAFGNQFDFDTVVDAALLLESRGINARFVMCGVGKHLERLRVRAEGSRAIVLPGWVGRAEIWSMMGMAGAGLAPYWNHAGFTGNFPNKPIEYFAGGLPVISSLRGTLENFLEEHDCGLTYPEGDPEALARLIAALMGDGTRLARMAANSRRVFDTRFDAESVYGRMIDYLGGVASHASAHPGEGCPR